VSTSVLKWSEGLRNRVSIIIRRYTGHMKFYCFFHILLVLLCIFLYMVQWRTQEFCSGGSTNSVEDRGQREQGSGGR